MDLNIPSLVDDDISVTNSSARVTPMDHNDGDSDDLQFVDDLNMESLEQSNTAASSSQSAVVTNQSNETTAETSTSNTSHQPVAAGPEQSLADKTESPTNDCPQDSPNLSSSQETKPGETLPVELPTFGRNVVDNSVPSTPPTVVSSAGYSLEDTNMSCPQDLTDNLPSADVDSSQSSHSDRPVSLQAVEDTKVEPAATVPNLIKHFIEGFTIEESTEPFPMHRSSLLTELQQRTKKKRSIGRRRTIAGSALSRLPVTGSDGRPASAGKAQRAPKTFEKLPVDRSYSGLTFTSVPAAELFARGTESTGAEEACATCGSRCVNLCFYRGEPFCSRPCVKKRKNVIFANPETAPPKRGRPVGAMTRNKPTYRNSGKVAKVTFSRYRPKSSLSDSSDKTPGRESRVPLTPDLNGSMSFTPDYCGSFPAENGYGSDDSLLAGSELVTDSSYRRSDVLRWTVSDVREFIQSLSGCERYCVDFEEQEIDGRALLLLNEDHLLNALDIKLGPALKIYQQINAFR